MASSARLSKRNKPFDPSALDRRAAALLMQAVAAGDVGLEVDGAPVTPLLDRGLVLRDARNRLVATDEGRAHVARAAGGELGFLAQHRAIGRKAMIREGVAIDALVDLDESPLAWLARRKDKDGRPLLGVEEVAAGERLRADFTRGQMTPRVTANWEASVSRGRRGSGAANVDLADAAMAARMRVSRALEVVGPELAGPLVDVCCFLKGLEEVERERRWPARGAKLVLGLALSRLARHYGYLADPARQGPGGIVSWGSPDSRPALEPAAGS